MNIESPLGRTDMTEGCSLDVTLAAIPLVYVCTYYVGQIRSRYQLNPEGRLHYVKGNKVTIARPCGPIQLIRVGAPGRGGSGQGSGTR